LSGVFGHRDLADCRIIGAERREVKSADRIAGDAGARWSAPRSAGPSRSEKRTLRQ
jgi:hypothetical protein